MNRDPQRMHTALGLLLGYGRLRTLSVERTLYALLHGTPSSVRLYRDGIQVIACTATC